MNHEWPLIGVTIDAVKEAIRYWQTASMVIEGRNVCGWEDGKGCSRKHGGSRIIEVQTWRRVRGPAGAVVCETRDLGSKWPHRHILLLEERVAVDMRVVCPQDVKKRCLGSKQGRSSGRKGSKARV